jgi:hypothetical protein
MQLPTVEDISAVIAGQPPDLPVGERIRRAVPAWFAGWTPEIREHQLARWQVIARTPSLRMRAAEFERATAGMITEALPAEGAVLRPGDSVVVNAYLSAYTAGLLAWADHDGDRKVEELIEEAFDALEGR